MTQTIEELTLKLLRTLNEAQARWYVAREAIALGRGGLKTMHELTGISRPTILKGIRELRQSDALDVTERIRRPGAGRKPLEVVDPRFSQILEKLMAENTAGDPMSALRWTNKSTQTIADVLTRQGCPVSDETVRRKLHNLGYTLQANSKTDEGDSPEERDEQFRYINRQVAAFKRRSDPVLSIDTKKKERVGNFKNAGRTWLPKGSPREVGAYDFPDLGEGPAIPYGAYDQTRNQGFVNVGTTHDTAEFAVESIRLWWKLIGRKHYADARQLLLCADGGGSNGSRSRAWKYHLQRLADETGFQITTCHYPPGTSKWNKIEHRMFSFISLHWRGQPLESYETVVNLIGGTQTRTGLRVKARLDRKFYETGIQITDEQLQAVKLLPHDTHPRWNYTITPRTTPSEK